MLWAIDRPRRHRALRASEPQLINVSKAEEERLSHGHAYFGGLVAFSFECPGPCSTVYDIRPRQRQRFFDAETQRFRCPDCGIELQLSILAEKLPVPISKRGRGRVRGEPPERLLGVPPRTCEIACDPCAIDAGEVGRRLVRPLQLRLELLPMIYSQAGCRLAAAGSGREEDLLRAGH